MDDTKKQDKIKIEEILEEIDNLKKYSQELASNTRGEKLENYIDNLAKNINSLGNKVETIYEEKYKNNNIE